MPLPLHWILLPVLLPGGDPGAFRDGARILWLGDSITHACRYTRYLEDYAFTRYPRRRIAFANAGVNGDTSADVLLRFDADVAYWKPTRVFVCLGMNDAGFSPFVPEMFKAFQLRMGEILDRIRKLGASCVLMTPPPVDTSMPVRYGVQVPPIHSGYNHVLARYGEWLQDTARQRRLSFVDLLGPMTSFTRRLRLENPGASLSPDGIHPGAVGSALIAMEILDRLGEPEGRWRLRLGGDEQGVEGAELRKLRWEKGLPSFELRSDSLPWVLPVEARGAIPLMESYAARNRASLSIRSLGEGIYALRIDGTAIVTRTARQWQRGVDLGLETAHPDWLLAERMLKVNGRRNLLIRKGIRNLWLARKTVRAYQAGGPIAPEKLERALILVRDFDASLKTNQRRILDTESEIRSLAGPRFHHYELVRS
ncbi:MAG: SGNH/GDSL hydrolase family protein [Planctomycetota bacterium]